MQPTRINLTNLPTPLYEMPRLSSILKGPRIWIKRDDCTCLAFGGTKVRSLEYSIADAMNKGADTIITTGGIQSNHARLTAAACRNSGLNAILILCGHIPLKYNGNILLDHILGADIRFARWRDLDYIVKKTEKELIRKGHNVYIIPEGGASPIGTMGYIDAAQEIHCQAKDIDLKIHHIIHASASGGTQTGLIIGNRILNTNTNVIGVVPLADLKIKLMQNILLLSHSISTIMYENVNLEAKDVCLIDYYPTVKYDLKADRKRIMNAIMLVAQTEGILLEPGYAGKAMVLLIEMIKSKQFKKEENIVFIHTGGSPHLFLNSMTDSSTFPSMLLSYLNNNYFSKFSFSRYFR